MDKDDFILNYMQDHAAYGDISPFMLHVRIATHGSVTLTNCHPFEVPLQDGSQMAIMHNGIISKMDDACKDTDLTDTEALVQEILSSMSDEWLDNEYLVEYIEDFIDYSKLVFLTTNPELEEELYILNEEMGVWKDMIWFSNYSCFPYKQATQRYMGDGKYMTSDGTMLEDYDWGGCMSGFDKDDPEFGIDSDYKYSSDKDDKYKQFGWYHNGVYIEGTQSDYAKQDFGEWLIDEEDRRYTPQVLRDASHDEHVTMFNDSLIAGDVCAVCTGILGCVCNDVCSVCYEGFHECECMGRFVSMTDSFNNTWGDRVIAITEAQDEAEKKDAA
jgi:hypothetical protein